MIYLKLKSSAFGSLLSGESASPSPSAHPTPAHALSQKRLKKKKNLKTNKQTHMLSPRLLSSVNEWREYLLINLCQLLLQGRSTEFHEKLKIHSTTDTDL